MRESSIYRVWTAQGRNHSLLKGEIELKQSEYYESPPEYRIAHARISDLLSTSQIIWCSTKPDDATQDENKSIWVLEVPVGEELAIIDGYRWSGILGQSHILPSIELQHSRRKKAAILFPNNSIEQRKYRFRSPVPNESLEEHWNQLLIQEIKDSAQVLLRHPIPETWVVVQPNNQSNTDGD